MNNELKELITCKGLALIIIAALFISCILILPGLKKQNNKEVPSGAEQTDSEQNHNSEEQGGYTGGFSVAGYGNLSIDYGSKTAEVSYTNPEENKDIMDVRYEMLLIDTGDVVFRTGVIEPGTSVKEAELLISLDKGNYDAVLKMIPILKDGSGRELNAMTYKYTLHVE